MYSLNAPVPSSVSRLARGLAADCFEATPRDRHTLVVKRLDDARSPGRLAETVRDALSGAEPFPARIDGVDAFREPTAGRGPVAYLRVESPGIRRLHRRLCERFDPIEGLEGDEYVPHVTIARGGDADRLVGRSASAEWTVDALSVWAAEYGEPVERIALPI